MGNTLPLLLPPPHRQECSSLGIQGGAVRPGLQHLATQLGPHFERVLEAVGKAEIGDACRYVRVKGGLHH